MGKKCLILSKSSTLGTVFQSSGYDTIVLSDSTSFIPILNSVPADIIVIDSGIGNAHDIVSAIFALPQIPERVTIREDLTDVPLKEEANLIRVNTRVSESEWCDIIKQNIAFAENAEPLPAPTKKDKILIIDDVVELVEMYRTMFEMKGYEVEVAKDGLEGITKAVAFQPKYILLDIMMPHMDGFALMKTFRENTSLNSVIIVNSNIDGMGVTEKIYAAGADYYIRKSDYVPTQIVYMIEQGMFSNKRKMESTK